MHREIKRRLVHVSGVVVPLAYLSGHLTWNIVRAVFVFGTLLTLVIETVRLFGPSEWVWGIFEALTREYEHDHLAGYALYMFSSTAVVLAFQPRVALPALLMLMLADPVIGVLGSGEAGSIKPVPVLFSMFAICTLIALPFVHPVPALLAAIAATAADGAKPVIAGYVIDDNLTIPPAAALAILAGGQLVHYLPSVG